MAMIFGSVCFNESPSGTQIKKIIPQADEDIFVQETASGIFQALTKKQHEHTSISIATSSHYTIIADARIFNYKELLKELSLQEDSKKIPDSKLILQSYLQWGAECLDKLYGDFAFAIWNDHKKELFMACDIMGRRCLFYSFDKEGRFYFSNLPKLIFDMADIKRTINPMRVADSLALINLPCNKDTFFENIKKLRGSCYLTLDIQCNTPIIKQYWDPMCIQSSPLCLSSEKEYHQAFRELFTTVISEMLFISNNRIACHLSGGLDSSAITCVAANLLKEKGNKLMALSHIPTPNTAAYQKPGWSYDDRFYIESVREKYDNVSVHYIQDHSKKFFDYSAALNPWLDAPIYNPANVLWILGCVETAKVHGINVILSGYFGNFTFSWAGCEPYTALPWWRRLRRRAGACRRMLRRYYQKQPWRSFSAIHPAFAKETKLLSRFYNSIMGKNHGNADTRATIYKELMGGNGAGYNTAIRFLHGVEQWCPAMDRRIIEFCLRAPLSLFSNKSSSRLLVKKSLSDPLPDTICSRTTQGQQAADWYKKFDRQHAELFQQLEYFKKTKITQYVNIDELLHHLRAWDVKKIKKDDNLHEVRYCHRLLRAIETMLFIKEHFFRD